MTQVVPVEGGAPLVETTSNALGGLVNHKEVRIVPGQYYGDVFEYIRNNAFNARNFFDGPKIPHVEKNNFGATLGAHRGR
jgi:hypothetical protein